MRQTEKELLSCLQLWSQKTKTDYLKKKSAIEVIRSVILGKMLMIKISVKKRKIAVLTLLDLPESVKVYHRNCQTETYIQDNRTDGY